MKKRFMSVAMIAAISGSVLFTSCIGSFGLFNKVLAWNDSVTESKFVNEVLFIALHIVPVYEISMLADYLVINSIEFWTSKNPVQAGVVKTVQGENGIYTVETLENGYHIENQDGNDMNLIFDKATNTWSAVSNGETAKLITIEDENKAIVYLPNGEQQRVDLSHEGTLALKQSVQGFFLAAK
ncbi:DUF3332 domain-containing protein [Dysgonomonas sp. 520]|uniref:DUF3332 domain-containing protein n=1 Tax=Dysgonomonas sp. 520 TaxID=2302931 RepID=UPI0013D74159|nr:DUF3332 domain-containing protein [Dysgonomonas sp. 520]NDW09548.1 DUF3332 domain-containing protein [Dysgonomonas sp. 520]